MPPVVRNLKSSVALALSHIQEHHLLGNLINVIILTYHVKLFLAHHEPYIQGITPNDVRSAKKALKRLYKDYVILELPINCPAEQAPYKRRALELACDRFIKRYFNLKALSLMPETDNEANLRFVLEGEDIRQATDYLNVITRDLGLVELITHQFYMKVSEDFAQSEVYLDLEEFATNKGFLLDYDVQQKDSFRFSSICLNTVSLYDFHE